MLDSLAKQIQRSLDIHEIQNLMSKYQYLHIAARYDEMAELFALKTPDVKAEMAWGVYEGPDSVRRLYGPVHKLCEGADSNPGRMFILPLTTPYIQVAGDGQTAQGMWISPGSGTSPSTFTDSDELQSRWEWCRYGCDFIKEEGQWKIWHLHVYGIFMTPYDQSWVEQSAHMPVVLPDELKPDRPSTYNWMYSPTVKTEYNPVPAEPYETWDDSMSYVP